MEILQATIGLIIAVTALITAVGLAVRLSGRQMERAIKAERNVREKMESDLRAEIAQERERADKAGFRIQQLEEQRVKDLALIEEQKTKIEELNGQVKTALNQLAVMQEQVEKLQNDLDHERRENDRLEKENKRLEALNAELFATSRDLQIENKTFKQAFVLLGEKLGNDGPEQPEPPTAPESKSEPEKQIA